MRSFSSKGLSVGYVTGNSTDSMKRDVLEGKYQLVFFTPECLIDQSRAAKLDQAPQVKL